MATDHTCHDRPLRGPADAESVFTPSLIQHILYPVFLYFRTMTTIHDKLLRGPPAPESNPASTGWFVHRLMAIAQEELDASGDRWKQLKDILIEGFLETLFLVCSCF